MNREHTLSTKPKMFWTPLMFTTSKHSCSFILNLYLCLENCLCIFPPSPNFHFTLTCYVICTLLSLSLFLILLFGFTHIYQLYSYHVYRTTCSLVSYPWYYTEDHERYDTQNSQNISD